MAITTKESILKVLSAYNPWWKTGMVSAQMSKTYKRFAFYEAMKRLAALGVPPGKQLGAMLERLLDEVIDERLQNDRAALLAQAMRWHAQSR